ncbi:hypothetical protein AALP_AA5G009900 [Arabis alpina]|uniref:Uncharacterized protein n=1 Tax=Arabis alpina TaxID=50452 RepID=A0A087GU64_ARAAL|nr:hypothetical protein AALP_AA5G009900 [Arabis alpina]
MGRNAKKNKEKKALEEETQMSLGEAKQMDLVESDGKQPNQTFPILEEELKKARRQAILEENKRVKLEEELEKARCQAKLEETAQEKIQEVENKSKDTYKEMNMHGESLKESEAMCWSLKRSPRLNNCSALMNSGDVKQTDLVETPVIICLEMIREKAKVLSSPQLLRRVLVAEIKLRYAYADTRAHILEMHKRKSEEAARLKACPYEMIHDNKDITDMLRGVREAAATDDTVEDFDLAEKIKAANAKAEAATEKEALHIAALEKAALEKEQLEVNYYCLNGEGERLLETLNLDANVTLQSHSDEFISQYTLKEEAGAAYIKQAAAYRACSVTRTRELEGDNSSLRSKVVAITKKGGKADASSKYKPEVEKATAKYVSEIEDLRTKYQKAQKYITDLRSEVAMLREEATLKNNYKSEIEKLVQDGKKLQNAHEAANRKLQEAHEHALDLNIRLRQVEVMELEKFTDSSRVLLSSLKQKGARADVDFGPFTPNEGYFFFTPPVSTQESCRITWRRWSWG